MTELLKERQSFLQWLFSDDSQLIVAIVAGVILAVGYSMWEWGGDATTLSRVGLIMVWVSLATGLIHGARAALESLKEFQPDIDVLMVVGGVLSALIGHPEEGALLLFMFTLAGALEHRAMVKARYAVSRLQKIMPKNALVKRSNEWVETEPEKLQAKDIVLVRPGETIPADGKVIDGRSEIDQSSLTGESLPRSVEEGDSVFAGTINQNGALEVEVSRPVDECSVTKILQLVLEAQERRQPLQRVIDKFSTPYTVSVFIAAGITLFGFWIFGEDHSLNNALYRAITLLVVASPCALVISTPTATLCGLSRAARSGVLVKGGDALERLSRVRRVVVDKTGTLTTGQIEVTDTEAADSVDQDELLSIAYATEARSTHPIAAAIVRMAKNRNLKSASVTNIANVPGRGVTGEYDGNTVYIGNHDFCAVVMDEQTTIHTKGIVDRIHQQGGKPVVVAHNNSAMVITVADKPRPGADTLAAELEQVGVSRITMLTGDVKSIADQIANSLGITEVRAELMPEGKVEEITRLRREHAEEGGLAVIGDGINDAPALAVADVGLAMGEIGADAALEVADVVLLHNNLNRVPWSFELARRVRRIMIANLAFATVVIAVLATITVIYELRLSIGVLGHEGSTLLVVANSLRLLVHKSPGS